MWNSMAKSNDVGTLSAIARVIGFICALFGAYYGLQAFGPVGAAAGFVLAAVAGTAGVYLLVTIWSTALTLVFMLALLGALIVYGSRFL